MATEESKNNTNKKTRFFGAALIMAAALMWSLDGVYLRPQLYALNPLMVVVIEHFLGFVLLSPFIFVYAKEIRQLKWRDWLSVLLVSALGGLLGTLAITKAFFAAFAGETTFAAVVIIQKLQPIFALVLARVFLKEKLRANFYPWAFLAVAACLMLVVDRDFSWSELDLRNMINSAGFMAFLAALCFGASTVFGKGLVNHLDHKASAAMRFGATLFLGAFFLFAFGQYRNIFAVDAMHWKIFATIAMTSGATAMFIYYQGLRKVTASLSTILELFWPFSAVILDYIINRNLLTPVQFISAALLLVFIYKAVYSGREKPIVFTANVISGDKLGAKLGFPTINLDKHDLLIVHGVYLVNADIYGSTIRGLMHFGPKQTFDSKISTEIFLEKRITHLPQEISVEVVRKLRDIKKFKTEAELSEQIRKDVEVMKSGL